MARYDRRGADLAKVRGDAQSHIELPILRWERLRAPPEGESKKINLFQLNRLLFSFGRYIVHSSALHNQPHSGKRQQAIGITESSFEFLSLINKSCTI